MPKIKFPIEYDYFCGKTAPWLLPDYGEYTVDLNGDSGFGARLNLWAAYQAIAKDHFEALFCCSHFPERIVFDFPNSTFLSRREFYGDMLRMQHVTEGSENTLQRLILSPELFEDGELNDVFYVNDKISMLCPRNNKFLENEYGEDPLTKVGILHEEELKELFSSLNVVHLRRYHGISYLLSDLDELPDHLKDSYMKEARRITMSCDPGGLYRYRKDSYYFDALRKYDSPKEKYYISTDLPQKYYYRNWNKQYKDRLVTNDKLYPKVRKILSKSLTEDQLYLYEPMIEYLTDFFAMVFGKQVFAVSSDIRSVSQWAATATRMRKNKLIVI